MISKFEWSKYYETGHEQIDADHRELSATLNEMIASQDAGEQTKCSMLLDQFDQQHRRHCEHEVRVMIDLEYGDLADHISEHKAVSRDLKGIVGKCSANCRGDNCLAELRHLLAFHILTTDLKIANFLPDRR